MRRAHNSGSLSRRAVDRPPAQILTAPYSGAPAQPRSPRLPRYRSRAPACETFARARCRRPCPPPRRALPFARADTAGAARGVRDVHRPRRPRGVQDVLPAARGVRDVLPRTQNQREECVTFTRPREKRVFPAQALASPAVRSARRSHDREGDESSLLNALARPRPRGVRDVRTAARETRVP